MSKTDREVCLMSFKFSVCRLAMAGAALALLTATPAFAQENAYIVHGIPGGDIGLAAELPVDISVDGVCAIDDFAFGDVVGPVPFATGSFDIAVYLSDEVEGTCTGLKVLELLDVPFVDGATSAIVAHLTQDGSTPGPGAMVPLGITASKFDLDLSAPDRGTGKLIAHHTAAAPTVDVDLQRGRGRAGTTTVEDFMWGTQLPAPLRSGNCWVQLRAAGSDLVAYGPEKTRIKPYQAFAVFAVGTALTDSFDVIGFRLPTALK
jgi:hypothetical protein